MDILEQARQREEEAEEHYREEESRMLEDFHFSNPAKPDQWGAEDMAQRQGADGGARPCITEDYTNQHIAQVENDARQNKPGIEVAPGDTAASKQAALEIEGHIRQIEYASRADIAYATSISHAARGGRGWIRIGTHMVNEALNQQEICILQVADALTVRIDPDSKEPDGCDAVWGFQYTDMTIKAFQRQFGEDTSPQSWGSYSSNARMRERMIRIAEHFWIEEKQTPYLNVLMPDQTTKQIPADQWEMEQQQSISLYGVPPQVQREYKLRENQCWYAKMSGGEVLEEPIQFPSRWIPLVPVFGHILWIGGKRYVCGLTRQLRDGQKMKNFERSAWVEWLAMQPRAPWVVAAESVEGFKNQWKNANRGNAVYLTYNAFTPDGQPLPPPQRTSPPLGGQAFAQGSAMATEAMQGSVGMYRSNFGAPSNAVSGRAKLADQREGDTATFHYQDNRARSIAHVGRIIIDMIPKVYAMSADGMMDQKREVRSMSMNGTARIIQFDASAPLSHQNTPQGSVVNPTKGSYEVRVKVGPAYNSLQEEASFNLNELLKAMPQLMNVIGPYWARMQKGPESEHLAKLLMTIATPAVQEIENQSTQLPPEAQSIVLSLQTQLQQTAQQMQQMQAIMGQMQQELQSKNADLALRNWELDIREQEVSANLQRKSVETASKVQTNDRSADTAHANVAVQAQMADIQAFRAETERQMAQQRAELESMRMELDARNELVKAAQKQEQEMLKNQPQTEITVQAI